MNVATDEHFRDPDSSVVKAAHGHVPVLSAEVLEIFSSTVAGNDVDAVIVDVTLGRAGHTEALLEALPRVRVVGVDRDDDAVRIATARLERFGERVRLVKGRFSEIESLLGELGLDSVDGILADFGVSSPQLDDAARGMSFRHEGPLDMRMDTSSGETALELIERTSADDLADIIYRYGDERRSRRIARCIHQALEAGDLKTTLDLRRAVVRAVGPARIGGIDPATRTFQALRIAVNEEMDEIRALIAAAPRVLRVGGALVTISFHSLEDRQMKRAFLESSSWERITGKPLVASRAEAEVNPRSRSAKLRAARLLSTALDKDALPNGSGRDHR